MTIKIETEESIFHSFDNDDDDEVEEVNVQRQARPARATHQDTGESSLGERQQVYVVEDFTHSSSHSDDEDEDQDALYYNHPIGNNDDPAMDNNEEDELLLQLPRQVETILAQELEKDSLHLAKGRGIRTRSRQTRCEDDEEFHYYNDPKIMNKSVLDIMEGVEILEGGDILIPLSPLVEEHETGETPRRAAGRETTTLSPRGVRLLRSSLQGLEEN